MAGLAESISNRRRGVHRALLQSLAFAALVGTSAACEPTATPSHEATSPAKERSDAEAVGEGRAVCESCVYVTNEISGDLSIIDRRAGAVVATVPLGKRPRGIRVGPEGRFLYVALSGSPIAGPHVDHSTLPPADKAADGIGVFDIESRKLVRVLESGSDPEQVAVAPDGAKIYVANEDVARASLVDVASGRVLKALDVGEEPEGVQITPDGRTVYVTSESDNRVFVIDTDSEAVVGSFGVGRRPRDIAFCSERPRAFVTNENDATVSVVDTSRHEVEHTIHLPGETIRPMGVVTSPDDARVYVTTGRGRKLFAIDAASLEILGSVEVGARPWGLAITADGRTIYTANGPSNDVAVVDAATLEVVQRIGVSESPWGVAIVDQGPQALE